MLKQSTLDNIIAQFSSINLIIDEYKPIEGNMSGDLLLPFAEYLSSLKLKSNRILEIGFNAGHSAIIFSQIFSKSTIVSIDICTHPYTIKCFDHIKNNSLANHYLIEAGSTDIMPHLFGDFDLIFIDGNHFGDTPHQDIKNCKRVSNSDTIIIIDDICKAYYGIAPTNAWETAVTENRVKELYRYVKDDNFGFAAGKYTL